MAPPRTQIPVSQLLQAIEGVMKILGSLLGGSKDKPPDDADSKAATGKTPPELAAIADDDKELDTSMQLMRSDLGAFGKSIGAIATGIIGALGYTRFNDIFPFPLGAPGWLGPATVAAATCGLAATTFLVFRFFFAKRRILIWPPPPPGIPLSLRALSFLAGLVKHPLKFDPKKPHSPLHRWGERHLIIKMTQPYAEGEGLKSLYAVEGKRRQLLREAHQKQPTGATDTAEWKEAYRLERVVDLALWDAADAVLERRTRGAFGGPVATIAIILAVGGIGFTFATADWAKGRRTLPEQRVREAQVCLARARTSTVPADRGALVQACLSKAKLDLGSTVTTVTVTTSATTTAPRK